eukprot:COSAG04_NODE_5552_length_1572_cov_2.000679_1_plen_83_part_10
MSLTLPAVGQAGSAVTALQAGGGAPAVPPALQGAAATQGTSFAPAPAAPLTLGGGASMAKLAALKMRARASTPPRELRPQQPA